MASWSEHVTSQLQELHISVYWTLLLQPVTNKLTKLFSYRDTQYTRYNNWHKSWIICVIKRQFNPSATAPFFISLAQIKSPKRLKKKKKKKAVQILRTEPWVCMHLWTNCYRKFLSVITIYTHSPSALQTMSKTNKQLNHRFWKGLLDPITLCCLISYIKMINFRSWNIFCKWHLTDYILKYINT